MWSSLPDTVVKAESVNSFKERLDRFWNLFNIEIVRKVHIKNDQEVKYNWKGTGSRSNVV